MDKFHRGVGEVALTAVCGASDRQAEAFVRTRALKFRSDPHTDAELYDFVNEMSKLAGPTFEVGGQRAVVGYIDGFLRSLCSLAEHYERPADGVTTEFDRTELDTMLANRQACVI